MWILKLLGIMIGANQIRLNPAPIENLKFLNRKQLQL